MELFDHVVDYIIEVEGGLVDNPKDPGGRTNMGVTQKALDNFNDEYPGFKLPRTVDELTHGDARMFYRVAFWSAIHGDDLPAPIALQLMDWAVNAGSHAAIVGLQRALRVNADGVIGPVTLRAVNAASPTALIAEFTAQRAFYYMRLADNATFGLGWARRIVATHNHAMVIV